MAGCVPPFFMGFRLAEIELDGGAITRAIYDGAPGGAFGKVFKGRWRGLRVAVKILATMPGVVPGVADAAFRTEVQNMLAVRSKIDRGRDRVSVGAPLSEPCDLAAEARRCTALHSLGGWPNAVLVFGVGTEPDLAAAAPGLPPGPAHLIVMEELTGGTLEAAPDDVDELVKVAVGLARGLTLLAAAHVVHADLKGANVMRRTPGGEVVLADYGVGRIANAGVDVALYTGDAAGTMLYLAPELIGGGRANTFASDVYAYGLVLWCLFSGRRHPFMDATGRLPALASVFDSVRTGGRPDLAALRPDTPPAVAALIQRCWAQEPAVRPTAVAIAQETAVWLMDETMATALGPSFHAASVAFQEHNGNAATLANQTPADVNNALGGAALAERNDILLHDYAAAFASTSPPIASLLPSQLIAVALSSTLLARTDVLMSIGTGQGKSIALALAAAAELKREPDSRVIILTSSDHLVQRDYAFARKVFDVDGVPSVAVTYNSASVAGFATARAVYVNAMAIAEHVSAVLLRLLQRDAVTPDELAFVRTFLGDNDTPYSVFMDEFDFVLSDVENQLPRVFGIPTTLLSRADAEHPSQDLIPEIRDDSHDLLRWIDASAAEEVVDPVSGVTRTKVYPMMYVEGEEEAGWFNLSPGVFRISCILENASRVMGVSSSTKDSGAYVIGSRHAGDPVDFFELPNPHDPTITGTLITPLAADIANESPIIGGSLAQLGGKAGIWCQSRAVVCHPAAHVVPVSPMTGEPFNVSQAITASFFLPTAEEVNEWRERIVADVASIMTSSSTRPVLIIGPSDFMKYKMGEPKDRLSWPQTAPIADRLIAALKDSFSAANIFVVPAGHVLTEEDTLRMGRSGCITVGGIHLGRGIDIRTDAPGGLHVVVATEVAHRRLLRQMIGRAGRLGHMGSYSIITLHRILAPRLSKLAGTSHDQWWMAALHHLTALGVKHLTTALAMGTLAPEAHKTWAQRWLLFLLGCRERGKQETARICELDEVGLPGAPTWCIPDADFAKLLALVPRNNATEPFYARLLALKAAGPQ